LIFYSSRFLLIPQHSYQGVASLCSSNDTPTKRQVSKRLVSKRLVSKRPVYKTSGLQNVRFTKRQVSKRLVSKRPVFKFDILIKQKV
jgi:hypothetical protein